MSQPVYDLDEGLWGLYINDCNMKYLTPSIADFLVWKQEEGYDADTEDWSSND